MTAHGLSFQCTSRLLRRLTLLVLFALALTPAQARPYAEVKAHMLALRDSLAQRYADALDNEEHFVVEDARKRILDAITKELFPAWMGTPWDFNGVTQTPREGHIACGYFVTTVLRDAGFGVERARLAQQASLMIIKTLSPPEHIKDWGGIDVPEMVRRTRALPDGLYVVGLDIHCGFVYHKGPMVEFVHASYGKPAVVVHEHALESKVLAQSKRFVLGRVDNDVLLRKWLRKEAIPTLIPR